MVASKSCTLSRFPSWKGFFSKFSLFVYLLLVHGSPMDCGMFRAKDDVNEEIFDFIDEVFLEFHDFG